AEVALNDLQTVLTKVNGILTTVEEGAEGVMPLFTKAGELASSGKIDSITSDIQQAASTMNQLLSSNTNNIQETLLNINSITDQLNNKLLAISDEDLSQTIKSIKETVQNIQKLSEEIPPEELHENFEQISGVAREAKLIMAKLKSDDPREDTALTIKRTIQRIDRISEGLEKTLERRTLAKAFLSRVPLPDKQVERKKEDNNEQEQLIKGEEKQQENEGSSYYYRKKRRLIKK
ncbi:MAG TPA: hypothetical protein V6C96_01420, partial [Vampirovibrionales bacterium]